MVARRETVFSSKDLEVYGQNFSAPSAADSQACSEFPLPLT
jgi:hypothetical protein